MDEDPCEINNNSNKRKFQDEISEVRVAKHSCLCSDDIQLTNSMSAKGSNSFSEDADSVMSVSDHSLLHMYPSSSSSSSSVNWSGITSSETKTCDASNLYAFPSVDDCELSNSEYETQQSEASMEDLFYSNGVLSNNSVLSSGRWNVNQDTEQGIEKLTIDKEFEQYFSMLML